MNTFMNGLTDNFNYARTENGALTHKSTRSAVYDMFALCAAYRTRSVEDCILMFKNLKVTEGLAVSILMI